MRLIDTLILFVTLCLLFVTHLQATNHHKIAITHLIDKKIPEHTLEATFRSSHFRTDYIQQPVILTKDNVPILLEDVYIEDITNVAQFYPSHKRVDGHYYAIDFTLNELKALNVYKRFDPERYRKGFSTQSYPSDTKEITFQISTLEEALEKITDLNKFRNRNVGIYVELKQTSFHQKEGKDLASIVLPILKQYGYQNKDDKFYLQILDFNEAKILREKLNYNGKLIFLISNNIPNKRDKNVTNTNYDYLKTPESLKLLAKYVDGIALHYSDIILDRKLDTIELTSLVKDAHSQGLVVHTYTIKGDLLPVYYENTKDFVWDLFYVAEVDGIIFSDFLSDIKLIKSFTTPDINQ